MASKKHLSKQLDDAIARRNILLNNLSRFDEYVNNLDNNSVKNQEIKLRYKKFEQLWDQFDSVQSDIEMSSLSDQFAEQENRKEFENNYFRIASQAEEIISNRSVPTHHEQNLQSIIDPLEQCGVKLQPISIPKFSGNYEDWLSFSDIFRSMVHNNPKIPTLQKFYCLRNSLTATAEGVIKNIEVTEANYIGAWELLEKRFHNTKLIVENHVKSLFDLPKLGKESAKELRHLLDNAQKHLQALKALGQPVNHWDTLLIHLLSSKFDPDTHRSWQEHIPAGKVPSAEELFEFLVHRCQILESLTTKISNSSSHLPVNSHSNIKLKISADSKHDKFSKNQHINNACLYTQGQVICEVCKKLHPTFKCIQFLNLAIDNRIKKVQELNLCKNCLKPNHDKCLSRNCRICNGFHNTLLHLESNSTNQDSSSNPPSNQEIGNTSTVTHVMANHTNNDTTQAILATALVNIENSNGQLINCRVLLDCGSQSNFISESVCNLLSLKRYRTRVPITGINSTSTQVSQKVKATIHSTTSDYYTEIDFLVIPMITNNIPAKPLFIDFWESSSEQPLADPTWNYPGRIDALIGAQHFWDLLQTEQVKLHNSLMLHKTKLGYIICNTNEPISPNDPSLCHLTLEELDQRIQSFWKIEEPKNASTVHTGEDLACEVHYAKTYSRDRDGRFIVEIPLKQDPYVLGKSRESALRQFKSLEKKLVNNPVFYQEYKNFMNEYEQLGHMKEVDDKEEVGEYFIPHHAVHKESSSTTKLRVVFNASAKTTSGTSFNDIQMVGPTIQESLFSILIRFRICNFILIADIEKMYRQTWIHPSQTKLQKIFWRNSPAEKMKTFKLLTVTYGTASAPYLATKTLQQLFIDEGHNFPAAARAERDFYVDNYMAGCNSIHEGLKIQEQLTSLLKCGGYHLRKWGSNEEKLLAKIPPNDKEKLIVYHFEGFMASTIKTLGLVFDPNNDKFIFIVKPSRRETYTKRFVISEVAQVFDPLGIIGPVILKAKSFMQKLWSLGLGWDEVLPNPLLQQWVEFRHSLSLLQTFQISRQVTVDPATTRFELHAFSDASEIAYGACIYIRNIDKAGNVSGVQLLCSKSRIAPLKTISLPRLELCGALLMAQLVNLVKSALNLTNNIFYWTDSTIVLAWINATSSNWATYVANRVAKIQELTEISQWNHVSGSHNPADIISRGMDVPQLIESELWWNGPSFLSENELNPSCLSFDDLSDIPEKRKIKIVSLVSSILPKFDILVRYSSFIKLIRVIAFCRRFLKNAKVKSDSSLRQHGPLSLQEYNEATNIILRLTQQESFYDEIRLVASGKDLPHKSKLTKLSPFIDNTNLLRVGGRISNANIPVSQKHPVILPSKHYITKLIAIECHTNQLHCGPQALLATLRLKYWPLNGRHLANNVVRNCIRCFKVKPTNASQIMGQLPESRVQPSRPFTHCGVDYAGPVQVRLNRLRKTSVGKAYISIFVCFATKAIHMELVEDLSSESFISALRRFISRRGRPSCMYSDNSTTFKGATKHLKELNQFMASLPAQEAITSFATTSGILWKFIPPYSPSMGGLWEANVKLVKYHLRRTMGCHVLTYVNLYTLLTEIEACVNSRPLIPLSNDPSDLSVLTPAHFLIGDSLATLPDSDLQTIPNNRLSNMQQVQQLRQHFWSRWSSEYLGELQKRVKWTTAKPNLEVGSLALIKDDDLPPLKWRVGRITELHPGVDNKLRVVSLKIDSGITRRTISKICPLPLQTEEDVQELSAN